MPYRKMAERVDILKEFFLRAIEAIKSDADQKGQKIPVSSLRFEADDKGGVLYGAHYMQYLVTGRGPGKFPPPDKMTDWVNANPDILDRARQVFRSITAQQLGFLIGRKIAREGTDIYQGKKPGIDLLGAIGSELPWLLKALGETQVKKVGTDLKAAVKQNAPVNV